jgi:5-methylthioadenosine/S-adenosylhomocysteine deaminase
VGTEASDLVIEGGVVLTGWDGPIFDPGTVVIRDGVIEQVTAGRVEHPPGAAVMSAVGKCVMPGLVDLHFHTALGKGRHDDLPLMEWVHAWWYPVLRELDGEAAYWAALVAYGDSLRSGTTSVNDMSRQLPELARAAEVIGIRADLANTLAEDDARLDTLDDARVAAAACARTGDRIRFRLGVEWMPVSDEPLLAGVAALAEELGAGIHIHLNESRSEVDASLERFGRRPTQVAYDAGLLGPATIAAHGVWLDDNEIELLARSGTHLSHNPMANAKLGNGVARLYDILAAGVNVGLGHDAAESNNTRDLWQTMRFASLVHRAVHCDAALGDPRTVLRMATANGGRALGTGVGALTAGARADVIALDLSHRAFVPLLEGDHEALLAHLVFAADGSCVESVIVGGRPVVSCGQLVSVDEEEVRREANRCFKKLITRIEGG